MKASGLATRSALGLALLAGTGSVAVAAPSAQETVQYVLGQGETLESFCRENCQKQSDWRVLARANQITQVLRVPAGRSLRVPLEILRRHPQAVDALVVQGRVLANDQPVATGALLGAGTRVTTGAEGYATLRLPGGSLINVQPNSEIELRAADKLAATDVIEAVIFVRRGRVETYVEKAAGPRNRVILETPVAKTAVRGTVFRVAAGDTSRTEVAEGRVGVSAAGTRRPAEMPVPGGFGTIVEKGRPPVPPVALLDAPDLAGVRPTLQGRQATVAVGAVAGASQYRVQLARDADFRHIVAEGVFDQPRAALEEVDAGEYFLRARGVDKRGLEGKDAVAAVRLELPPAPPSLKAPAHGAGVTRPVASLGWAGTAPKYWLQVARDADFRDLLAERRELAAALADVALEDEPRSYYWRVASITANGTIGPFSASSRLAYHPPGMTPKPEAMSDEELVFGWPGKPGQQMEFQMAAEPTFAKPVFAVTSPDSKLRVPRPERGEYFYRMRQVGASGEAGAFSEPARLDVPPRSHPWWLLLLPLAFVLL